MSHVQTRLVLGVWVVVTAVCLAGVHARSDDVSRTTADEPQYLLSALSLWHDHDLDVSDELRSGAYRPFHEAALPEQTRPLADGRRVSPHDPLLPLVLAAPMGLGGWVAAKATLAVLAGALAAATTWVSVHRFSVSPPVAAGVAVAFGVVPPLAVYGVQVYPELPAALVVVLVVGALAARPLAPRHVAGAAVGIVLLPWLAVKYVPVVVVLGAVLGATLASDRRWAAVSGLAAAGLVGAVSFAWFHQVVYEGWTAYAAGDHFVDGELTVMGRDPDYAGRTVRLAGLLVDTRFGLAAWAPAFLFVVPAVAAVLSRRPPGSAAVIAGLAAGWANATWVALTMSGWWWPGRQVVVVVPLAVVAVAWWIDRVLVGTLRRRVAVGLAAATVVGLAGWLWLLAEVLVRRRDLIIDFTDTAAPTYRVWSALLPDTQVPYAVDRVGLALWVGALVLAAFAGWRGAATRHVPSDPIQGEAR